MPLVRSLAPRRRHPTSAMTVYAPVVLLLTIAGLYLFLHLMVPQKEDPDEGAYLTVARLLNLGQPHSSFSFDQFWLFPQLLAWTAQIFGDSLGTGRILVVIF